MSKLLEKVAKLIALSASPNENEARTSAFKACELVREHKLVISAAHDGETAEPPPRRVHRPPSWAEWAPAPTPRSPIGSEGTIRRSDRTGHCAECSMSYITGSRIVATHKGWVHLKCWRHA